MTGRERLAAFAILALVSTAALVGPALVAPLQPARAASDTGPVGRLTIATVAPDLVTPGSTVRITGIFVNDSALPLTQVQVRMRPVSGRLGSRAEVDSWLDGLDAREGVPVAPVFTASAPVPAGGRARYVLEVPAAALGLSGQEFGAYPLALDARATPAGSARERVAFARTTVQWQSGVKSYEAQRIAWVVPFTGLPGPSAAPVTPAQVAAAVGPGSRLRRLLDAASAPGVTWAVDPQLLATLRQVEQAPAGAGGTPGPGPATTAPSTTGPSTTAADTAPPSTAPPSTTPTPGPTPDAARAVARDYLQRMRAAAAGREVLELPYGDPDLQVLSDAGRPRLAAAARAVGAGTIAGLLGVTPVTAIGWPVDGYASDRLVGDLSAQGTRTLLLDARSRPLVEALNYTPDARTTALPGQVTAILADPQLSRLMSAVRSGSAAERSRFLAQTAAATTERPGLSRRLVVMAPRTLDPDPAAFYSTVASASTLPWLTPVPLGEALAPTGDRGDTARLARRALPAPSSPSSRGVSVADVDLVTSLRGELSALGEVVDDPVAVTAQAQRSTLDLLSSSWRGHRPELVRRQERERSAVRRLTEQVRVLPTTITFLRNSGQLQLTISNELDQQVTGVRVRVVAPNPRLLVQQEVSEPLTLAAGTRASVRVPVIAQASGEVVLTAQLVAPSGAVLGATERVPVRVRPTDSWVVTAGGVIAALVLAVGLVRSVRRPRRPRHR